MPPSLRNSAIGPGEPPDADAADGGEPTYRVSELGLDLKEIVQASFASVWVVGEVQKARLTQRGHFYFDLVEKGGGDEIVGRLEAVLWRTDFERVRRALGEAGATISEGLEIRCRASLDFYPPSGRLQLVVRDVDAIFSLGLVAKRRRDTLIALEAAGLLERNRALDLPAVPLTIGLITSEGSAAYHDFLSCLRESGYGFRVRFVHASVQGPLAERELLSALAALGRAACDCWVVVRGGGSKTDLAAFDGRRLAEAVARAGCPVLAGLGHETDRSVVDEVAHTSLKTPTKVAEFLIARVRDGELVVTRSRERLLQQVARVLAASDRRLAEARRRLPEAGRRVRLAAARLNGLAAALGSWSRSRLQAAEGRRSTLSRALVARPAVLLKRQAQALDQLARIAHNLSPRQTLMRGYSITRIDGRVVRTPSEARPGQRLETELQNGVLSSTVDLLQDAERPRR